MKLRLKTSVTSAVFTLGLAAPAFAAPLSFPDVPANHWAKDAVETLAAKHIVEGYPDGTYKGDRATTRWELAMVVARLLKQIEDGQSNFATKQDLEAINRLANSLKDELEALGQRVTKLEGDVSKLDQRVNELDRVTFYGSVEARLTSQCFSLSNKSWDTDNMNYDSASYIANDCNMDFAHGIGTAATASFVPASHYGLVPVSDMTRGGVALTDGTGFTMKAILGLRVRVSNDVDAGAEFAAYSSVGDSIVDAMWGVQAPYSCNAFSSNYSADSNCYTRMVLDNFWVMHNPSGTKLTVGAFNESHVDNILFAGQPNYGAYGNEFLDNFGFDVNGSTKISDWGVFRWELMGTRLGDGSYNGLNYSIVNNADHIATDNLGLMNQYQTNLLAADLGLEFGAGQVKVNFMHVVNEAENSDGLDIGAVYGIGIHGYAYAPNMSTDGNPVGHPLQWVNPLQYTDLQGVQVPAGPANVVDDRPITNGGNKGNVGMGTFGPQRMDGFSVKADYKWDIGDNNTIYAAGQYARTQYKSNKNSNYTSNGNAYKGEVGANLLDGDLDVALGWVGTDPNYDPFVNVNPYFVSTGTLQRTDFIHMNQYSQLWSLHDVDEFTHNRKGLIFNGQWRFAERRGLVWAKAKLTDQVKTSLYDNMYDTTVNGTNYQVMGFNPGFMDSVFYGYSKDAYLPNGKGGYDVIDGFNQRGRQDSWGIGANYKWENPRIKVDLGYEGTSYNRNVKGDIATKMYAAAEQSYVNMTSGVAHLGLGWEANDKWTIRAGCDWARVRGHWDPWGQYGSYATRSDVQTYDFDNINVNQVVPYIGFDYDMTANTQWNLDLRYYDTRDGINSSCYANNETTTSEKNATAGFTAHPFSWYGWQVTTAFKVKF